MRSRASRRTRRAARCTSRTRWPRHRGDVGEIPRDLASMDKVAEYPTPYPFLTRWPSTPTRSSRAWTTAATCTPVPPQTFNPLPPTPPPPPLQFDLAARLPRTVRDASATHVHHRSSSWANSTRYAAAARRPRPQHLRHSRQRHRCQLTPSPPADASVDGFASPPPAR